MRIDARFPGPKSASRTGWSASPAPRSPTLPASPARRSRRARPRPRDTWRRAWRSGSPRPSLSSAGWQAPHA